MATLDVSSPASYDGLAAAYDLLTATYRHDRWLAAIEDLAIANGLTGRRVLDVACGTGKSFMPLLERGYEITGCDLSAAMVAEARRKASGRARLYVADMCRLPADGPFDLVTCLDDAINHLRCCGDVLAAFRGIAANLAPKGLLVFDVNTLAAYRSSGDIAVEDADRLVVWRGRGCSPVEPAGHTDVQVDVFSRVDAELWRRTTTTQRHRHYPLHQVRELLDRAGLEPVACHGQRPGVRMDPEADEHRHHKALFVARRPQPNNQ